MARICLLVFFFLSGISGLIYQIAWVRQTTFTFGVSVYAYSAVIGAYMIGLSLGSWVMGKRIDRSDRPLRTYAFLEVAIAVLAALSPFLLSALHGLYAPLSNVFPPGVWLNLVRLVFSLAVLTPTTFLIGATLPVMSRIYANQSGRVGRDVGRLYLVNTTGAALGCILTGLVFLRVLGLRETIFLGATINLIVAAGALLLNRFSAPTAPGPVEETTPRPAPGSLALSEGALTYVAVAYGISGFIALGYEVVWARILYIHTSHAVYSFSLMLTVFLTGLAAGSAAGTWWLRRRQASLAQFGLIQLAVGLLALLVLFVFALLPSLRLHEQFGGYSVPYELLIAFITLFPPTFLLGALFPVVGSLYTRERPEGVGLRIGRVNALNTAGAIVGSLGVGFVLVPLMGLRNTTVLLATMHLALGAGAWWLGVGDRARAKWALFPIAVVALLSVIALPRGLYLGSYYDAADRLVFYKEGVETTVAVLEIPEDNFKISFVNGRDEVPTDRISMRAFRLLGHLPALLKPRARNALVLSFGNGIATGTLNTHEIPVIDAVDLSREMTEAARVYAEENYDVLNSDRLRLHIEDGRNFLLRSEDTYDIITVDATHPANASSWALFTREFYQLVDQRLADDGVFMQWIPLHSVDESDYRAILRTVWDVFPNTSLWSTGGTHSYVVSTRRPLTQPEFEAVLIRADANPLVRKDLGSPSDISGYVSMMGVAFARYVRSGPIVTDNNAFFVPIR